MNKKIVFATLLTLVMGIGCLTGCGQKNAAVNHGTELASGGILVLSVNPEIAVEYDEKGIVTGVAARNDDALKIINECTGIIGQEAAEAVKKLVNAIGEAGYFVEEVEGAQRQITIEIEAGSVVPHEEFLDEVVASIRTCIDTGNWDVPMEIENGTDYGVTDYDDTDYGPNNDGVTDYDDTDYGPNNDGVTDYAEPETVTPPPVSNTPAPEHGVTDYDDTDYGPNNDGVTDYDDTDYGPNNDGVTDYDDTDYGPNNDGVTDYAEPETVTPPPVSNTPAPEHGVTDYDDTDYGPNNDGVTDYDDTDYGPNNDGVTDYDDTDYDDGESDYEEESDYDDSDYED